MRELFELIMSHPDELKALFGVASVSYIIDRIGDHYEDDSLQEASFVHLFFNGVYRVNRRAWKVVKYIPKTFVEITKEIWSTKFLESKETPSSINPIDYKDIVYRGINVTFYHRSELKSKYAVWVLGNWYSKLDEAKKAIDRYLNECDEVLRYTE